MFKSARSRVFIGLIAGLISVVILVAFLQRRFGYNASTLTPPVAPISEQSNTPLPEPNIDRIGPPREDTSDPATPTPELTTPPESTFIPTPPAPTIGFAGTINLIVPVAGVQPDQLQDTFSDARVEGRVHDAIDIPAPLATPVLAVADGQILKLFQSERGGTTIYQLSTDKKLVFYYAHLQRYADGVFEGKRVRQGEVIGHVGDTGNAEPGNYHLHFSIMVITDPKRYWEGLSVNPYPLLRKP